MSSPLPIHFEAFGPVTRILHEIDAHLLALFPEQPADFPEAVKKLVKLHASENDWKMIALDVSKGLARTIINDLVHHPFPYKGNIVIDPTASTSEHNIYESCQMLKVNKERLIMVNEATDDVLVVMFGFDQVDRSADFHLLQRHLRMTESTFDMLMEEDTQTFEEREIQGRLTEADRKRFLAREQFLILVAALNAVGVNLHDKNLMNSMDGRLRFVYLTVQNLLLSPNNPMMQHLLEKLLFQLRMIPKYFSHFGFDPSPILDGPVQDEDLSRLENRLAPQLTEHKEHASTSPVVSPAPVPIVAPQENEPPAQEPHQPHHLQHTIEPEPE